MSTSRGPVRIRSLDGPMRLARDGETFSGPEEFTIEKSRERLVGVRPPGFRRERARDVCAFASRCRPRAMITATTTSTAAPTTVIHGPASS